METRNKGAARKTARLDAPQQLRRRLDLDAKDDGNDTPKLTSAPTHANSPATLSSVSMPGTQALAGFDTPVVSQQQPPASNQNDDVVDVHPTQQEQEWAEDAAVTANDPIVTMPDETESNTQNDAAALYQRDQMLAFSQFNSYKPSFLDYQRWLEEQPGRSAQNAVGTNNRQTVDNNQNVASRATQQQVGDLNLEIRQTMADQYQSSPANTDEGWRTVFNANPDLQMPPNTFRRPANADIQVAVEQNGNPRRVIDIRTLYLRRLDEYKGQLMSQSIDEIGLKTMLENAADYVKRITEYVEKREDTAVLDAAEAQANQSLWEKAHELGDFIKINIRTKLQYLQAGNQPNAQLQSKVAHARRLVAKIEPFDGDWQTWPNFKSKWIEYYHNSPDMSKMDLLVKLDEFIVPGSEPCELIASYERSLPESYDDAWKRICDTYDNPRRQVDDIIRHFMTMPTITDGRASYLCAHNNITSLVQTLPRLGVDVTHWGPMLMHVLQQKLDPATTEKWRQVREPREVARLEPFLDFLRTEIDKSDAPVNAEPPRDHSRERRDRSRERRDRSRERRSTNDRHRSDDNRSNQNRRQGRDQQNGRQNGGQKLNQAHRGGPSNTSTGNQRQSGDQQSSSNGAVRNKGKGPRYPCPICPNADHPIYYCSVFNKLNRTERINEATKRKLCLNCLRPKCSLDRCTLPSCPNGCEGKHNRLICIKTFTPTVNVVQKSEGDAQ